MSAFLLLRPFLLLGTLSYWIYMGHSFVEGRVRNVVEVGEKLIHRPLFEVQMYMGQPLKYIALPGI